MPSKKGRRRQRVAASDEIGFADEAKARILYRTELPTSSPEDWLSSIGLDGGEEEIDVSAAIDEQREWEADRDARRLGKVPQWHDRPPRQCVWPSRRSDRPDETLYRIAGARRDRWHLTFAGQVGGLNRELTREAAVHWLRIQGYKLPPDLRRITRRTTDADHPRLHRDWRPGADDHRKAGTDPSDWEVDPQIIETLRAVGRRLTTEGLLTKMSDRGLHPSVSTVKKRLAYLVKAGRLTKDSKARPRGYGLPQWNGSSGSLGS
jgi:hypothetical protein